MRIAITSLSIDVLSEIPLQAGQTLQLAVSQTDDGIRLAVVGQGAGAAASVCRSPVDASAPDAAGRGRGQLQRPYASAAEDHLTPLERLAVSTATQTAATQQGSLAPLFANLGVVAPAGLPPKLQQAVAQVLAQRTSLDQNLTGGDSRMRFRIPACSSRPRWRPGSASPPAGMPDLKAALIVLRQTLLSSLGAPRWPRRQRPRPRQRRIRRWRCRRR